VRVILEKPLREYDAAVERLNALLDEIEDNSKDPQDRLIETLSVLIEAYDRENHSFPEALGVEVIRFLMEEHGLTQKDPPEIGSQGVVSGGTLWTPETERAPNPGTCRAFWCEAGAFLDLPLLTRVVP
jgi:antitoxin component HigA of HigAB toxin-antitoxin module